MGVLKDGQREKRAAREALKRGWRRRLGVMAAGALLLGLLAGCSSKQGSSGSSSKSAAASMPAAATAEHADNKAAAPAAMSVMDQMGSATADTATATANDKDANAENKAQQAAAKTSPSTPAAGITPPIAADSGEGFNRKLIYKANLVMEVADYGDAQTKLRNLTAMSGAFILQFNETTNDRERSGNYTIKVAASGFSSFLDGLEKISPSLQRSVQGQDVTEEYVDLEARLKAKQAVEARLLAFMEKAQKTEDLVAFSNELSKVQTEIEQIKGRTRYLDQNVALSTIELRLYQKLDGSAATKHTGPATFGDRLQNAMSGSLRVMSEFGQGLLIVIAAIFPVLILCAILFAIYLLFRRQRARKLQQVRAGLKHELPAAAPSDGDSTKE